MTHVSPSANYQVDENIFSKMCTDASWFPQPRKYYFPGQIYHFPAQSIQDLKVINQDLCKIAYLIYSKYDQLLTFYGTVFTSPLLAV